MPGVASRGRSKRRTINEINMVPFIDVMLVLLIIFMVTAPLIAPSMVELPSVGRAARAPDKVIQVLVEKDDRLSLNTGGEARPVALKDLAPQVKAAQAQATNTAVVISADRSVKYESVVKAMDALQRAGVQRVGLSVQVVN